MFRGVLASWAGAGQGGLSAQGLNRNESGLGLGSGLLESVEWAAPVLAAVPGRASCAIGLSAEPCGRRARPPPHWPPPVCHHIAHMPWAKTILLHRLFRST